MEITKNEALGIIQKTDPRHEAYYVKQEPALVDAVREAFEREPEESSDPYLDKMLSASMEKPKSEAPNLDKAITATPAETSSQELSPEAQEANQKAATALFERYGDRAPAIVARAQNVSAYLEGTSPMWSRIVEVALTKGVTQDVMIEILDESGIEFGFDDRRKE